VGVVAGGVGDPRRALLAGAGFAAAEIEELLATAVVA
jgi:hypothetical protein